MLLAALLGQILGVGLLPGDDRVAAPPSYLYNPAFHIDGFLRGSLRPYVPQPGDIFLATDQGFLAKAGHRLALSGAPHHSGIVFARPDGSLAILEAGPHNTLRVRATDWLPHLESYAAVAQVYIRCRREPLTSEESARLTSFALAQDGKPFGFVRMLGQLTPLRCRGLLRTYVVGGPHGERRKYFCSELVMEGCVWAGLLDPEKTRPAATYPRDIFFGDSPNLFLHRNLDINSAWNPPARWMGSQLENGE
jgi:hypothetical protein